MKTKIILTRRLPDSVETRMRELFDAVLNEFDQPFTQAQLIDSVKTADVLVPTVTDNLNSSIIEQAGPRLRLIASFGTGVDHINVNAAREKGITVTNTPGVLSEDTADVAMALILAVPRRIVQGDTKIRSGQWDGWSPTGMLGHRINGKRLGIIGMGSIGQAIARRAKAFGMSIHYHNRKAVHPSTEAELEATYWENVEQMLPRVDIISVNCPSTTATHHLLNAHRLSLLSSHCYLVNTGRGDVIDELALIELLKQKKIAGAGLDVFRRKENGNSELLEAPNTILIPHLGSATVEGRIEMGEKVIVNIKTFIDGHNPPNRII